jgi:alkyl hydroperoxide reductase subunit AhpF
MKKPNKNPFVFLIVTLVTATFVNIPKGVANSTQDNSTLPSNFECDVIINGGSLAGFAAALSSSNLGSKTCLIEPTSWLGGQLTNQGVSAFDFPYQKLNYGLDMSKISTQSQHIPANLRPILAKLKTESGTCWVSKYCNEPKKSQIT